MELPIQIGGVGLKKTVPDFSAGTVTVSELPG